MERRLAAILAADVVGYSRLMEADEAGTLAALKAGAGTCWTHWSPSIRAGSSRPPATACWWSSPARSTPYNARSNSNRPWRRRMPTTRGPSYRAAHRRQPGRRHGRGQRSLRRRRQHRRPPGSHSPNRAVSWSPARPMITSRARLRSVSTISAPDPEKHRRTSARLSRDAGRSHSRYLAEF